MARRNQYHGPRRQRPAAARTPVVAAPRVIPERSVPVVYGKPFIVLEDNQKGTFIYEGGKWVPHSKTIAECKQDCQVKVLSQKINGMTRYEICMPVV